MLSLLSLLTTLAATDTVRAPLAPARQTPAAVVVHRQPAIPLVSLRLAVLADDPLGLAGAGHLLQHLHYPALREQVARVGGRIEVERSSDAIVYTATGPASELGYLAEVLRSALRPPAATEGEISAASRELREERLAEWETARSHVRAALRARLFPADLSAAGTEASAARLREASLESVWERLYRPERVSVVAVGDVRVAEVERAFADLPAARVAGVEDGEARDTVTGAPLAAAEATQAWTGLGYAASDLPPAALSITARLLREQIRARVPAADVEAEHWWTHHGQALVIVASAPEPNAAAAQRALGTAVTTLGGRLSAAQVRDAARTLRRDMLFYARTPDRMAGVIGQFTDREGDPDAAQRFYAELEEVEVEEVARALELLAARTPVRIEIPPQKLIRR